MSESSSTLPILSMDDVISTAHPLLENYMNGTVPVMKSRWPKVNKIMLGGFQFNMNYLIAGASGHGKSYLLNMLLRDFTSPAYNPETTIPTKLLHFSLEMSTTMELLRRVSSLAKVPLSRILQADEPLNEVHQAMIYDQLKAVNEPSLYYVDTPGNRQQIVQTILEFIGRHPGCRYVVCLDHTLLVQAMPREDEITTIAELGKVFITLRKRFPIMFISLGQLNDKIESEKRRDPDAPHLHYPTKTDIHGSKQLYHAMDTVMVLHQPAELGIESYGRRGIPTRDLVALHYLKQRHSQSGIVLLKNNLKNGTFEDYELPSAAHNGNRNNYGI